VSKLLVDYGNYVEETIKGLFRRPGAPGQQRKESPPQCHGDRVGDHGSYLEKTRFLVLVRPSRYTYTLMEETGEFTVNVVPPELKEAATYCGTVSGRDHDKFKDKGLTQIPSLKVKPPIIKEGILHFECRVVYKSDLILRIGKGHHLLCLSSGRFSPHLLRRDPCLPHEQPSLLKKNTFSRY